MIDLHQVLQDQLSILSRQLSEAKTTRDNAPTRMEARYDAERPVSDHLVEALEKKIKLLSEIDRQLDHLPSFKNLATVNSLITLRTPLGIKNFLLVPEGLGGQSIGDTFLLSIETPLAKSFQNQKVGYTFSFNGGSYQLVFLNPNI